MNRFKWLLLTATLLVVSSVLSPQQADAGRFARRVRVFYPAPAVRVYAPLPAPPVYVAPAPVYVAPAPLYVAPPRVRVHTYHYGPRVVTPWVTVW